MRDLDDSSGCYCIPHPDATQNLESFQIRASTRIADAEVVTKAINRHPAQRNGNHCLSIILHPLEFFYSVGIGAEI